MYCFKIDSLDIKTKFQETYKKTLRESINHYIKSHPFIIILLVNYSSQKFHNSQWCIQYSSKNINVKIFQKLQVLLITISVYFILGGLGSLFLLKSYLIKFFCSLFITLFI